MSFKFANNARSTLASPVASGDASCTVTAGTGALFPSLSGSDHFRATLSDSTHNEIVDVTARSTDTFTITRAQEGTSAHDFAAGATIALLITKEVGEAFVQAILDTDVTLAANADTRVATQKAIKAYVDNKVAGLSWKQEVRAATTTNGTLASAFANGQTIDGVTLVTGDRILLKNQSAGAENGIYVVAASGAPARATDADSGAELVNATCFVSEGTANADTMWTCATNATITPGSTSLSFVQLALGVTTLAALTDVTLTSPANLDVLAYDSGSSKWVNIASTGTGNIVRATGPTLSSPIVGTQSAGDNSTKGASTAYVDNAVAKQPETLMIAVSDETTALTTGTAKVTFRMPFACSMTAIPRANVNTVSSSGLPTFDIKKNGTTIFSTTLTIDASEKTSVTAATPAVLTSSPTTFADDDEITIDIGTAGTGTKGAKITLNVVRT